MNSLYFQDHHPNAFKMRNELIKNLTKINYDKLNILEEVFFSDDNINLINKQLILTVWKRTNKKYKIIFQNKSDLIIVMRYYFIENAKHLPYNIKEQIQDLNCLVVNALLPGIITNFEQKLGYLRDIETRGALPNAPINTKTQKNLPSQL
jgi:hypothetical protein